MGFKTELEELIKKYGVSVYSVKDFTNGDINVMAVEFCTEQYGEFDYFTLIDETNLVSLEHRITVA